jgi:hypothetical protein
VWPVCVLVSGVLSASPAIFKPSRRCASILSRLVRRVLSAFSISLSLSRSFGSFGSSFATTRLKTLPSDIFLGCFFSPSSTCARVPQQHFCPAHRQPKSVCDRPTGRVCVCACRVCECVLCVYTAAAENLLTPLLLPSSLSLSRLNTQVRLLDYLP